MNTQIRRNRIVLFFLTVIFMTSARVFADSLYLDTQAIVGCAPITVNAGAAQIICTTNAYSGITPLTDAQGDLSKGVFGSLSFLGNNNAGGGSDSSFVQVTYFFNVSGVQNGSAQFDLSIPGTLTPVFPAVEGEGFANANLDYLPSEQVVINGQTAPVESTQLFSGTSNAVITTPISNGTTELEFSLFTDAAAVCPLAECESRADFLDPTSITSASVYDSNGNLVQDASLLSQSGFNPNGGATSPVPEPSAIVLLSTGLLGLYLVISVRAAR